MFILSVDESPWQSKMHDVVLLCAVLIFLEIFHLKIPTVQPILQHYFLVQRRRRQSMKCSKMIDISATELIKVNAILTHNLLWQLNYSNLKLNEDDLVSTNTRCDIRTQVAFDVSDVQCFSFDSTF